ncbi:MAG: GTP 3',8-cyclase MoaA [Fibrobacterales bacterium]
MIDIHNRSMRKLRVSITDACNYRCFYCMPENITFQPFHSLMTVDDYQRVIPELITHGIEEIKITGGEPTIRKDFQEVVSVLTQYPNIKYGLTTNGQTLHKHLTFLKEAGVTNLNISLDTLDPQQFSRITKNGDLSLVLKNILTARDMGFTVKINCVVFKGINDSEILDFHTFSSIEKIEVRFLELMKIGSDYKKKEEYFISAQEMIAHLEPQFQLTREAVEKDSTSFIYSTDAGARIGFIASESQPFCDSCSRLRLTATGILRSCLMSEEGASIRNLTGDALTNTMQQVIAKKPTSRIDHIEQAMHTIGG